MARGDEMSGDHNQHQKDSSYLDKLPPFPKAERIEAVQFCDDAYWFSSDQLREYGELCRQQAQEEAEATIKQQRELLERARNCIDALPGYPKGADLCDEIDKHLQQQEGV